MFGVPLAPTRSHPVRTSWSRQLFASGEVATTVSGRETAPFPKVSVSTDRATRATMRRVDVWLLAEAREELVHRRRPPIEFFLCGVEGANPSNLSPADREVFDAMLFDPGFWSS